MAAVFLLCLVGLGFWSCGLVWRHEIAPRLTYSQQLDHGEGLMLALWRAQDQGHGFYEPVREIPWVVNNYPPLFTVLIHWWADTPHAALTFGRTLSFLSLIWASIMIAFIVIGARRGGEGRPHFLDVLAGLMGGCLFFLAPDVAHWGSLMRVDMLGVSLALTGLAFVAMAGCRKTWPIVVAALFFLGAIGTKHTLIGAPGAFFLGCWPHRRRRSWRFALWMTMALATFLAWGWWRTHGEMAFHLIRANRTAWSIELATYHLQRVWQQMGWAIVLSVAALSLSLFVFLGEYRQKGRTPRFVLGHYLWLTALALILTGKSGSSSNYDLEFLAAISATLGLLLGDLAGIPRLSGAKGLARRRPALLCLMFLAVGMTMGWPSFPFRAMNRSYKVAPQEETAGGLGVIVEELAKLDGPLLSQDMSLVVMAGKDVVYHPFMMPDLARRGLWQDTLLIKMIDTHQFPAIILSFDLNDQERFAQETRQFGAMFTPGTLRAIHRNYVLKGAWDLPPTKEQVVIYVPRT